MTTEERVEMKRIRRLINDNVTISGGVVPGGHARLRKELGMDIGQARARLRVLTNKHLLSFEWENA